MFEKEELEILKSLLKEEISLYNQIPKKLVSETHLKKLLDLKNLLKKTEGTIAELHFWEKSQKDNKEQI